MAKLPCTHSPGKCACRQSFSLLRDLKARRVDPEGAGQIRRRGRPSLNNSRQARSSPVTACMSFGGADSSSQAAGESDSRGSMAQRARSIWSSACCCGRCTAQRCAGAGRRAMLPAVAWLSPGAAPRDSGFAAWRLRCEAARPVPQNCELVVTWPPLTPALSDCLAPLTLELEQHMPAVMTCTTFRTAANVRAQGLAPAAGLALPLWE